MKRVVILVIILIASWSDLSCYFFKKSGTRQGSEVIGSSKSKRDKLKYIASKKVMRTLKRYEGEQLDLIIEKFWQALDPTPATAANEIKEEYYRRIDYANDHFTEFRQTGWKTDRGRIYVLYGPPEYVDFFAWTGEPYKSIEIWLYHRPATGNESPNFFSRTYPRMMKFAFADRQGYGVYSQIYSSEPGEISDPIILKYLEYKH